MAYLLCYECEGHCLGLQLLVGDGEHKVVLTLKWSEKAYEHCDVERSVGDTVGSELLVDGERKACEGLGVLAGVGEVELKWQHSVEGLLEILGSGNNLHHKVLEALGRGDIHDSVAEVIGVFLGEDVGRSDRDVGALILIDIERHGFVARLVGVLGLVGIIGSIATSLGPPWTLRVVFDDVFGHSDITCNVDVCDIGVEAYAGGNGACVVRDSGSSFSLVCDDSVLAGLDIFESGLLGGELSVDASFEVVGESRRAGYYFEEARAGLVLGELESAFVVCEDSNLNVVAESREKLGLEAHRYFQRRELARYHTGVCDFAGSDFEWSRAACVVRTLPLGLLHLVRFDVDAVFANRQCEYLGHLRVSPGMYDFVFYAVDIHNGD